MLTIENDFRPICPTINYILDDYWLSRPQCQLNLHLKDAIDNTESRQPDAQPFTSSFQDAISNCATPWTDCKICRWPIGPSMHDCNAVKLAITVLARTKDRLINYYVSPCALDTFWNEWLVYWRLLKTTHPTSVFKVWWFVNFLLQKCSASAMPKFRRLRH